MIQQIDTLQQMTASVPVPAGMESFSFKELLLFGVSLIATFVSADNHSKPLHKTIIIGALMAILIFFIIFQNKGYINIPIVIYAVLCIILTFLVYCFSAKSNLYSREKIEKEIMEFTKQADTKKEIRLFSGDLDFFGDVDDMSILKNKQYEQLKSLKFHSIKVLCIKPNNDKDELRIGFLLKNFENNIKIKFYDELNCGDCNQEIQNRNSCSVKNIKTDKIQFHEVYPYCKNPCYNPDLSIRGRIITKSNNAAESASIIIKYEAGKKYILKKYNSEDKECRLYLMLWEVWWNKCAEYLSIQNTCKARYEEYNRNKSSF